MIDQDRRGIDGRNFSLSVKQYAKSFSCLYDNILGAIFCASMACFEAMFTFQSNWIIPEQSFLFLCAIGIICILFIRKSDIWGVLE